LAHHAYIFPVFILSWIESKKDFEGKKKLNITFEQMDQLPHSIFVIVNKSQAKWYLDYVEKYPSVYIVVLPSESTLIPNIGLDVGKMMAEKLNIPFYWRISHNISDMSEFIPMLLSMRRCTTARGMLYGQLVLSGLFDYVASTIGNYVKQNQALLCAPLTAFFMSQTPPGPEVSEMIQRAFQSIQVCIVIIILIHSSISKLQNLSLTKSCQA
jgi:hypothetical protein